EAYARFTTETALFAEVAHRSRRQVMRELLASDVSRLTELFVRLCEASRMDRDYTRPELEECLREVLACLPVDRTYVRPRGPPARPRCRAGRGPAPPPAPGWGAGGAARPHRPRGGRRARRGRRRAGRPVPADVEPGRGQGRRGHRDVPLPPARGPERGGRR